MILQSLFHVHLAEPVPVITADFNSLVNAVRQIQRLFPIVNICRAKNCQVPKSLMNLLKFCMPGCRKMIRTKNKDKNDTCVLNTLSVSTFPLIHFCITLSGNYCFKQERFKIFRDLSNSVKTWNVALQI